jgi:hypothetical protein
MQHNTKIALSTFRRNVTFIALISYLFIFVVSLCAEGNGTAFAQTDRIFNRAFLESIKNVQQYEQIVKLVGVRGMKVGISTLKIPGEKYHWKGRDNSSFNIRVNSGKIVDANVVCPDGNILSLEGNGEITAYGK